MWQSWVLLQSLFKIKLQVRIGGADYVAIALSNPLWCSHGGHAPCGLPPASGGAQQGYYNHAIPAQSRTPAAGDSCSGAPHQSG